MGEGKVSVFRTIETKMGKLTKKRFCSQIKQKADARQVFIPASRYFYFNIEANESMQSQKGININLCNSMELFISLFMFYDPHIYWNLMVDSELLLSGPTRAERMKRTVGQQTQPSL